MSSDEEEPFLPSHEKRQESEDRNIRCLRRDEKSSVSSPSSSSSSCCSRVAIFAITVINLIALLYNIRLIKINQNGRLDTPSQFDEAISYHNERLDLHKPSPYTGVPSPALDRAWLDLLYYTNIQLTEDELRKVNKTSLKIKGKDTYVGYLEVYHQLHCVKRMIQTRHKSYYPELVAKGKLSDEHFDHCIEVLRRGIMCRADTTMATLKWDESQRDPWDTTFGDKGKIVANSYGDRKCVNWAGLVEWSKSRFAGEDVELDEVEGRPVQGPLSY